MFFIPRLEVLKVFLYDLHLSNCPLGIVRLIHRTFNSSPFQVLVLLTGGDWDPKYQSQWTSYANNLKNLPVDMYSFSVGSVPSQQQLQGVIPYNRDIFRVSSYDTMDSKRPDVVKAIRGGKMAKDHFQEFS